MIIVSKIIYGKKIKAISTLWVYGMRDGMFTFDDVPRLLKNEAAYYLVSIGSEILITDPDIKQQAIEEYNNNKTNSAE